MSAETFTPLTMPGFQAILSVRDGALELSLRGNGDMTVSAALGKYLKEVDVRCQREHVKVLEVKLVDLYFLSSSCFQAVAAWVLSIAARPLQTRYTVKFETHSAQSWQKRSLEAIRRVAPTIAVVV
jgi:hypothetical protein